GKQQIIFPGGDAVLYGLDADSGKMIWKFQCHAELKKAEKQKQRTDYPIGTPVVAGDRAFVGLGVYPDGPGPAPAFSRFFCVDITKSGDVSGGKDSALAWSYGELVMPKPARGRRSTFRSTLSTAAVHDDLVYISE